MKLGPRIHDIYVGRNVLLTVLVVWLVLLGLDAIMALSGEANNIGTGSYSFSHALAWTAYTLPRRAYTLFPMAAVIGALMGLGQLAATSELTALRAKAFAGEPEGAPPQPDAAAAAIVDLLAGARVPPTTP